MAEWHVLGVFESEDAYEDYRDDSMCCAAVFNTVVFSFCRMCIGEHTMIERRLLCSSPTCKDFGDCDVVWKVRECKARDQWDVKVNRCGHARGAVPCSVIPPPRVTNFMRQYITLQDECGVPPRAILVNLKKQPNIPPPRRGWPDAKQLRNALKRIRRQQGAKNTIKAVQEFVRARAYHPDIASDKAFVFGYKLDADGHAYVGSGEDDDPFTLGITSLALIDNCLKYSSSDQLSMFHGDATFKLSDIGYPVITCGFTDRARSYQLGAMFVVSQRTCRDYMHCFLSFARTVFEIRGRRLRVDAVMGDAEDAQVNSYSEIPEFAASKVIMCFFHVLYNVRKRVQHLSYHSRKLVMEGIMDMHYTSSVAEFHQTRDDTLASWRKVDGLQNFVEYFEGQWLTGKYWRWQSFHTPGGYAVTNNPCEVFNSGIKSFMQRKRYHMRLLLLKLCELSETVIPSPPVANNFVPTPTTDLTKAASALIDLERVIVDDTLTETIVRVREIDLSTQPCPLPDGVNEVSGQEDGDDEAFREAFDSMLPAEMGFADGVAVESSPPQSTQPIDELVLEDNTQKEVDDATEEDNVRKQKDLYTKAAKWSLRRAHRSGMPTEGWTVDLQRKACSCKYFSKFLTCMHIVIALRKRNLVTAASGKLRTESSVRRSRKRLGLLAKQQLRSLAVDRKRLELHPRSMTPLLLQVDLRLRPKRLPSRR